MDMDAKDPSSLGTAESTVQDPVEEEDVSSHAQVRLQRGVLVVPFIIATALTYLILLGAGQQVRGTMILVPLIVGAVVAASSLAWSASKHPPSAPSIARSMRPDEESAPGETGGDPLAHIHVVEDQARRHKRPCPNCGTPAGTERERCPNCDHILLVECKGCRTKVRLDWGACPECGRDLP